MRHGVMWCVVAVYRKRGNRLEAPCVQMSKRRHLDRARERLKRPPHAHTFKRTPYKLTHLSIRHTPTHTRTSMPSYGPRCSVVPCMRCACTGTWPRSCWCTAYHSSHHGTHEVARPHSPCTLVLIFFSSTTSPTRPLELHSPRHTQRLCGCLAVEGATQVHSLRQREDEGANHRRGEQPHMRTSTDAGQRNLMLRFRFSDSVETCQGSVESQSPEPEPRLRVGSGLDLNG